MTGTVLPITMEPMLPRDDKAGMTDLAVELVAKASELAGQIQHTVRESIGDLVRSMNCYYSNLIEGHNTHPRDIDAALEDKYSPDPERRALQKEARAHIEVQRLIDNGDDPRELPVSTAYNPMDFTRNSANVCPTSCSGSKTRIQARRCALCPEKSGTAEVAVGRHIAPPAADLPRFLNHFETAYTRNWLSRTRTIIAAGAAHHRFLWIHPFYDGNGRVARLMSHAMLFRSGVGSSLWPISRGLARNVTEYKNRLAGADAPRQGNYDGRGERSAAQLEKFCVFFLRTCIDQVEFMSSLLQPGELLRRMQLYAEDEVAAGRLPARSMYLLREALLMGEFARGRAPEITGYQERRSRQILSTLLKKGLLVSRGPRAPVRLGFPLDVVERWFPRLYPVD